MKFEMFKTQYPKRLHGQQWYWRCRAKNNKILAVGGEGYSTKASCKRALQRFLKNLRQVDRKGGSQQFTLACLSPFYSEDLI